VNAWARAAGQLLLYGLFAAAIGYFSTSPRYTHLPADQALVKVSFTHTAQRVGACRRRSDEELAKLPPNMRVREECPRERAEVVIELDIDGKPYYRDVLRPSGLSRDGATSVYRRFPITAGKHEIEVRLSDNASGDFNFERSETIDLAPAQILLVDLDVQAGGLQFRH